MTTTTKRKSKYPMTINLKGNRRLINLCRKSGLKVEQQFGEWNGYGRDKLGLAVTINGLKELRTYERLKKQEAETRPKPKSQEQVIDAWAKRLAKLGNISVESARAIAQAKLKAQEEEIQQLEERQAINYSTRRSALIRDISRRNPLRRIEDAEHAHAILKAHERHSDTYYNQHLEHIHELEQRGLIDKGQAQEIARANMYKPALDEQALLQW